MQIVNNTKSTLLEGQVVQTQSSDTLDLNGATGYFIQADVTVTAAAGKTFVSGREKDTLTFPTKAGSTGGDYIVITDTAGLTWAAALNKSGADPAPTGAIYTAIPAGRKVNVDISGGTDAASVAALVETALNALTGFTAKIVTDDTAANGTMTLTHVSPGAVAVPAPHNANDSGAGSITTANNIVGATSAIDLTANTITKTAHGFATGLKGRLTTNGTAPTGLSTGVDYFVIVVDDDTFQLAASLDDANAGTAIDITGYGLGTQTYTATALAGGTIKLQHRLDSSMSWVDVASSSSNVTVTASFPWDKDAPNYGQVKVVYTLTAGQLSVVTKAVVRALN
jgi:hypothetical protein